MTPCAVDSQTIANISTAAGVFVALVGVIVTLILALRSQKLTREGQDMDRQQSQAAAARSEAAAALTEEYTRRVVDALETMASREAASASTTLVPRVKWSLTNHGHSSYKLENDGDTTARNVQVTTHRTLVFQPPDPQDIGPGEALTFLATLTMGTEDSTITVHWSENDPSEVKTWKYPLPPPL